jgi:hypothetical protein
MTIRRSLPRASLLVALAGMLTAIAGCASGPAATPPSGAPAAVQGSSGPVPFAGGVPWGSAVLERDGRTLHLLADWDRIRGGACALPNERTLVRETPTAVTVSVLGYADPLPPNVACGSSGTAPQPETLVLRKALGTRALIDGTDHVRRAVLADDAVPTLHASLPGGYEAVPMTWAGSGEPHAHSATRLWRAATAPESVFLRLTAGLPKGYDGFGLPVGRPVGTAVIGSSRAQVYDVERDVQTVTTVRWTSEHGRQLTFEAFGTRSDHLPVGAVVALAETVR